MNCLKWHTFVSHNFCGPGIQVQCSWAHCSQASDNSEVKVTVSTAVSSEGSSGEGSTSELTYLLVGRIQLPWAVGMKVYVPC